MASKAPKAFPLSTDFFHFSGIAKRHCSGCAFSRLLTDGEGLQKGPLSKIYRTHPTMMKFSTFIFRLKKIQKIYHETHPLGSAEIIIFSPKICNFCYIKKYRYRLHINTKFLIFLTLKVVLINIVAILMMSAKLSTLGLVKIKCILK